jgi:thioredoxin reductase (NADPH)
MKEKILMKVQYDVVVVGAGCAGMTAAIYLKRFNLNVVMIEKSAPGGQINRTDKIENYPGFNIIEGPTLAMNIFMQTQNLEVEYRYGDVLNIIDKDEYKIVKTDTEEITTKAVVIASGRKPRELGLPNEKSLTGRGISWCAICDGPLFKNKEVVVVGGGNSAFQESLYLADICKKVTIIHRRNTFTADNELQEKVLNNKKIKIILDSEVITLNEKENKLASIVIKDKNAKQKTIKSDGLFIYIGFEPVTDMVKDFDILENNYIVTDDNMRTKIKGIYACGDVIKKELYQITTSVGEASKAAMSAKLDLK